MRPLTTTDRGDSRPQPGRNAGKTLSCRVGVSPYGARIYIMRILIASDIHGSFSAVNKFSLKIKEMRADLAVMLGDVLYHGPRNPLPDNYNPAEVCKVLAELPVPVIAVRGNCDAEVDELVLPFHLAESSWIIEGGSRIFAIHGHQLEINGGSIKAPEGAAVLSGHTHLPTADKRGSSHYWNPGSCSLPKQAFPASFGIFEDNLFRVESFDGQVLMTDHL